jgi:DNA-nicking Smr family endonuclease
MSSKEFASRPFEKLKKQIERTQAKTPSPPSARLKKKEESTDDELFSGAMKDVQEIEDFRTLPCGQRTVKPAARANPVSPDRAALAELDAIASGEAAMHLPDTQEYVEWCHPDQHESILKKLHEGRYAVQATVDLHGFTVPEAEEELELFLRDAFLKGAGCVKIIHGRGLRSLKGPRLKDAVIRRLLGKHRGEILAFVSARQCDGGLGAVYLLLRKRQQMRP